MSQSNALLTKFLFQMTEEEFLQLNELRKTDHQNPMPVSHSYAHGVSDLAEKGRRIVFDVEKARNLADEYQMIQGFAFASAIGKSCVCKFTSEAPGPTRLMHSTLRSSPWLIGICPHCLITRQYLFTETGKMCSSNT